jgi:hypothetical protein
VAIAFVVLFGVLLLGSIVLGIAALCGIRKHGIKRILARALIGIGLSLGIVGWWVWAYLHGA